MSEKTLFSGRMLCFSSVPLCFYFVYIAVNSNAHIPPTMYSFSRKKTKGPTKNIKIRLQIRLRVFKKNVRNLCAQTHTEKFRAEGR